MKEKKKKKLVGGGLKKKKRGGGGVEPMPKTGDGILMNNNYLTFN